MNMNDIRDLYAIVQATDGREESDADMLVWYQLLHDLDPNDCAEAIMAHRREQPGVWLEPGHVFARVKARRRDMLDRMDTEDRATMLAEGFSRRDQFGSVDKSAGDEPDYPADWTTQQRLDAYWAKIDAYHDRQERDDAYNHRSSLMTKPPATSQVRAAAIQAFVQNTFAADPDGVTEDVPHVNHLMVRCPHCHAAIGDECTTPSMSGRFSAKGVSHQTVTVREKLKNIQAHPSRLEQAALHAGYSQAVADGIVAAAQRRQVRTAKNSWENRDMTPEAISEPRKTATPPNGTQVGLFASQGVSGGPGMGIQESGEEGQ